MCRRDKVALDARMLTLFEAATTFPRIRSE
jgi:hypothetical protein